jgi:hypothetical protein
MRMERLLRFSATKNAPAAESSTPANFGVAQRT